MTDLAVAAEAIDLTRSNEEAIRLLRLNRKTAESYMADEEEACARAQITCDVAQKEVERMKARIEAIDIAIKKLS